MKAEVWTKPVGFDLQILLNLITPKACRNFRLSPSYFLL